MFNKSIILNECSAAPPVTSLKTLSHLSHQSMSTIDWQWRSLSFPDIQKQLS